MNTHLLLQPIQIGRLKVRNRLMMTTHNPKMTDIRYRRYIEERAAGGVGMIGIPILHEAVSSLSFTSTGRIDPLFSADWDAPPDPDTADGQAFFDELLIPRLRAYADIIHRYDAVCFGQIAERGAGRLPETFQPRIAPSGITDPQVRARPHELSTDEVGEMVRILGRSSARIKAGGLDGVEIHGAHGYIVEQFLSPLTNRRTDRYGGSLENRSRFLEELIAEIRRACGDDYPIGLRLTGYQQQAGGWSIAEAKQLVQKIAPRLAYVNITAGTIQAISKGVTIPYVAPWTHAPGFNTEAAAAIKSVCPVPLIVTGRFNNPELMEQILREEKADIIGVARTLMADPDFLKKVEAGRPHRIRKCIGANECHYPDRPSACAVNAMVGREVELRPTPAAKSKKVLIIGGGPAGLEAARVASLRGHHVTLLERSEALGGQVAIVSGTENRREMRTYIDFLVQEVRHQGVDIEFEVDATVATIKERMPDALVIATGSRPEIPGVAGLRAQGVFSAMDVHRGVNDVGRRVLVVGGLDDHLRPPMTAELLADKGCEVVLITECLTLGQGLEPAALHLILKRVLDRGIQVHTLTELVADGHAPVLRHLFTRREHEIAPCDSIVFAGEHQAEDRLADAAKDLVAETYKIGDCLAPRRLVHATLDGARIGVRL